MIKLYSKINCGLGPYILPDKCSLLISALAQVRCCSGLADIVSGNLKSIGRATSLAISGVPSDQIMKLGRWKSNAFSSYIRPSYRGFLFL